MAQDTAGLVGAPPVYRPFGRDTWRDPYALYRRLRDDDPVHRSPEGYWVLSRFAHVYHAARDTATYSSAQGLTFRNETEELGLLPTIVMMDPPDHTLYRSLVSRDFTPRRVQQLEDAVREFVRERVAHLRELRTGDFVEELARRVPTFVVAHYLGVPEADRARFDSWTVALVQAQDNDGLMSAGEALTDLYGYFAELVERRRVEPADDMLSTALREAPEVAGEHLLGYAFVMMLGGNDTATGLLAGSAELLTDRMDQRRRLGADPSLVAGAVEELLRLTSPVQGLCRVATHDVEVDGTTIPAGDRVLLCYGAANRDPREFGPDADELDVGRVVRRILSFGTGPHYCLGAHAARLQGRVVVEELLRTCPELVVDAAAGRFAGGAFTRRYDYLPFSLG